MDAAEQQLIRIFRRLDAADRATLYAFGEFLAQRGGAVVEPPPAPAAAEPGVIPDPEPIERPASETVVGALKRLSRTYPMLDKSQMLSATSDLIRPRASQDVSQAAGAIDALEEIFREHYRQLSQGCDDTL